jgi:hypothetical protein
MRMPGMPSTTAGGCRGFAAGAGRRRGLAAGTGRRRARAAIAGHRRALAARALCSAALVAAGGLAAVGGAAQAAGLPPVKPCAVSRTFVPRLAYVTDRASVRPTAWAAHLDASQPVELGRGTYSATVSRDGSTVAVVTPQGASGSSLVVVPSDGGRFKTLLQTRGSLDDVTWSESGWLAVVVDERQIIVFGPSQRVKRTLVRAGGVAGVSFMPGGCSDRLVYGRATANAPNARVDLYAATLDGRHAQRLTRDGRSLDPLWGPAQIAYSHERLRRNDAPVYQLSLIGADGRHARSITHVHVGPLVSGLTPTAWSDDGKRLLAEFVGQDTSEAWTVQVPSGRARDLTGRLDDVSGAGLSGDGRTVLVQRGSPEDAANQSVATIPFGGGPARVLVTHAGSPSWNG